METFHSLKRKFKSSIKGSVLDKKQRIYIVALFLLETGMRIGNPESVKEFETFGATTLLKSHVKGGKTITIEFLGKKKVPQKIQVTDEFLVKLIKKLKKSNSNLLFNVSAYDIRNYLKEFGLTPKDLRQIKANHEAKIAIKRIKRRKNRETLKKEIREVCEYVSSFLGNTPQVAKRSYIYPETLLEL